MTAVGEVCPGNVKMLLRRLIMYTKGSVLNVQYAIIYVVNIYIYKYIYKY